jgi:hypothetical protein
LGRGLCERLCGAFVVERLQFVPQDAHGPAVADRVVQDGYQDPPVFGQPTELEAEQRGLVHRERACRLFLAPAVDLR